MIGQSIGIGVVPSSNKDIFPIYEHQIIGKRMEADISGNYSIPIDKASYFVLKLTGNTTISDTGRPSEDHVKTVTAKVTGDFTLDFDFNYNLIGDQYVGTKWNLLTFHFGNGTPGQEDIIVDIRNL